MLPYTLWISTRSSSSTLGRKRNGSAFSACLRFYPGEFSVAAFRQIIPARSHFQILQGDQCQLPGTFRALQHLESRPPNRAVIGCVQIFSPAIGQTSDWNQLPWPLWLKQSLPARTSHCSELFLPPRPMNGRPKVQHPLSVLRSFCAQRSAGSAAGGFGISTGLGRRRRRRRQAAPSAAGAAVRRE